MHCDRGQLCSMGRAPGLPLLLGKPRVRGIPGGFESKTAQLYEHCVVPHFFRERKWHGDVCGHVVLTETAQQKLISAQHLLSSHCSLLAALQTNQTQSQNREYEDKVSTLVKSQPCTEENLANILEMVQ